MSDPRRALEVHQVEGREVKSCIMDKCKQSHLALPDSLLKRSREYGTTDDVDLGLEKKMKANA